MRASNLHVAAWVRGRAYGAWHVLERRRVFAAAFLVALFLWVFVFPAGRSQSRPVPARVPGIAALSAVDAEFAARLESLLGQLSARPLLVLNYALDPVGYGRAIQAYGDVQASDLPAAAVAAAEIASEMSGADVWFGLFAAIAASAFAARATRCVRRADPGSPRAAALSVVVLMPFGALLADWAENAVHWMLLRPVAAGLARPSAAPGAIDGDAAQSASTVALRVAGALEASDLPFGTAAEMWLVAAAVLTSVKFLLYAIPLVVAAAFLVRRTDATAASEPPKPGSGDAYTARLEPVLCVERSYIEARRRAAESEQVAEIAARGIRTPSREPDIGSDDRLPTPGSPGEAAPIGLAFSGGGIRSATFNLGVLQGLSKLGVLPTIDYVSSVSGGGFPAACLTSLLSNASFGTPAAPVFDTRWRRFPLNPLVRAFDPTLSAASPPYATCQSVTATDRQDNRNVQLDYLRNMGNYLVPRTAALGRDALRGVGAIVVGILYTSTMVGLLLTAVAAAVYLVAVALTPHRPGLTPVETSLLGALGHSLVGAGVRHSWLPYALVLGAGLAVGLSISAWLERKVTARHLSPTVPESRCWTDVADGRNRAEIEDTATIGRIAFVTAAAAMLVVGWVSAMYGRAAGPGARVVLPVAIWLPAAFAIGNMLGLVASRLAPFRYRPREGGAALPTWGLARFRTVHWAAQGVSLHVLLVALALGALALPLPYAWSATDPAAGTSEAAPAGPLAVAVLAGLGSTLLAVIDARRDRFGDLIGRVLDYSEGVRNALLALLVLVVIGSVLFALMSILHLLFGPTGPWAADLHRVTWVAGLSAVVFLLIGRTVNLNYISPHYFTRDAIADTFLRTEVDAGRWQAAVVVRDHRTLPLTAINPDGSSAPYHLVGGALNLSASWHLRHKDRLAEPFLFSRAYCGSPSTGYVRTADYGDGLTKYARALAISGAAVSPAAGHMTHLAQAFVLTVLNLRLGLWIPNPRGYDPQDPVAGACDELGAERAACLNAAERTAFWPLYLFDEMSGRFSDRRRLVNVTDGAHTGDNAGLYALFQRRCRVIVAGDASADHDYAFTDLFRVIRQVRTDLGIEVEIDVTSLRPAGEEIGPFGKRLSPLHCAIGRIRYPALPVGSASEVGDCESGGPWLGGTDAFTGWLVYVKPVLCEGDPAELLQYFEREERFPLPSTADQFFDEYQYASQRALGQRAIESVFAPTLLHLFRRHDAHQRIDAERLAVAVIRQLEELAGLGGEVSAAAAPVVPPESAIPPASAAKQSAAQRDLARGWERQRLADPRAGFGCAHELAGQVLELVRNRTAWDHRDVRWEACSGVSLREDQQPVVVETFVEVLSRLEGEEMQALGVDFVFLGRDPFDPELLRRMAAEVGEGA